MSVHRYEDAAFLQDFFLHNINSHGYLDRLCNSFQEIRHSEFPKGMLSQLTAQTMLRADPIYVSDDVMSLWEHAAESFGGDVLPHRSRRRQQPVLLGQARRSQLEEDRLRAGHHDAQVGHVVAWHGRCHSAHPQVHQGALRIMIILVEQGSDRMVFDNVTHITEKTKPSIISGTRTVVNIYSGETLLMGGDDIELMTTKISILPNAEREDN
jgi:hypothetical protein